MFDWLQSRKRYGNSFPRTKAAFQHRKKLFPKTLVSRFATVKLVDVFEIPIESTAAENNVATAKLIKEIIFAVDLIVVVTVSATCRAYDISTGDFVCELNQVCSGSWKKVTTAVYNQSNDTVVVIFEPCLGGLQCKVIDRQQIKKGSIHPLDYARNFESTILYHPAFFEFDDANCQILAAQQGPYPTYQFWDFKNYKLIFSIAGESFEEVRISHGIVAMFKPISRNRFVIVTYDIENGEQLIKVEVSIDKNRSVELVELLVSQLMLKQDGSNLRLINLLDGGTEHIIPRTERFNPLGFIFYEVTTPVLGKKYNNRNSRRFMTISIDVVEFWSLSKKELFLLHSIQTPGLREAAYCIPSLGTNTIATYSSNDACLGQKMTNVSNAANDSEKQINFYSIEDGEFIGFIKPNLCGSSVKVFQLCLENSTVVCGDENGIVRIIRMGS